MGGIPQQITDGETGRLIGTGAGREVWQKVLEGVAADPGALRGMAKGAQAHAEEAHDRFRGEVLAVTA